MTKHQQRISVFRTDRIGEVLLSTVSVEILKKNYPDSEIVFFTSPYASAVVAHRDDISEIIPVDLSNENGLIVAYKLTGLLRERKFDMAVVLNANKIVHFACFLAGIPRRCGYDRKWGFLLTDRVFDRRHEARMHEVEYTNEFFRALGLKASGVSPRLCIEDGTEDLVQAELADSGADVKKPIIVVHPCASNPLKFWSAEKYTQLLHQLQDINVQIIVIGEQTEYDIIAKIIADSGCHAINAAGMFTLEELAGLLKLSSLFIGNDSGPMHMAAVLGRPVIAIFSKREIGSNPVRWRPWGDNHAIFHELYGEQPSPLEHFSGYYVAHNDIAVDEVFQMAKKFLNESDYH